jgi:excisionase family DNA binding protein
MPAIAISPWFQRSRGRHLEPVELPEVVRVSEVAELLRVSNSTVYGLCDRGELPHLRVSAALRIHRDSVRTSSGGAGEQLLWKRGRFGFVSSPSRHHVEAHRTPAARATATARS